MLGMHPPFFQGVLVPLIMTDPVRFYKSVFEKSVFFKIIPVFEIKKNTHNKTTEKRHNIDTIRPNKTTNLRQKIEQSMHGL